MDRVRLKVKQESFKKAYPQAGPFELLGIPRAHMPLL